MKKFLYLFLLLMVSTELFASEIELIIEGVEPDAGSLFVFFYDKKKCFLDEKKSSARYELNDYADMVSFVIEDIEPGNYSVFVFQDMDGNGKFSRNLFGMAQEPFGVSMNKLGAFGRPVFSYSSFEINKKENVQILIVLNHP